MKITSICLVNGVNVPADALMFRLQMLLAGLSVTEVENILTLAIANDGALDASDIPMMVKQKLLRNLRVELYHLVLMN